MSSPTGKPLRRKRGGVLRSPPQHRNDGTSSTAIGLCPVCHLPVCVSRLTQLDWRLSEIAEVALRLRDLPH
jgi:hypothetical protein